jgi:hypothetical protein
MIDNLVEIIMGIAILYGVSLVSRLAIRYSSIPIGSIEGAEIRVWKRTPRYRIVALSFMVPLLKPVIILDPKLFHTPCHIYRTILAHELAHIERKSGIKTFILIIVFLSGLNLILNVTSNPFVPIVYTYAVFLLLSLLHRYEEFKADEIAMDRVGVSTMIKSYAWIAARSAPPSSMFMKIYDKIMRISNPTVSERIAILAPKALRRMYRY